MIGNTDPKPTTVRETLTYLLRGLHRAPLGFFWGAVALFPIVFCIVYGHCRHMGAMLALVQSILWVTICSPIIILGSPFAAFDGARIAVDSTDDHYGFRALRSAFQEQDA